MLTIVTPVQCLSKSNYLYERVIWFIENSFVSDDIQRIIVDYASPNEIASDFKRVCEERGILYVELRKYGHLFSAGECRNTGVALAKTEYITFQDVDLFATDDIYSKILEKTKEFKYFNDLIIIPCLYLSKEFSEQFLQEESHESKDLCFQQAYEYYLEGNQNILMYAPVTSMVVVKRRYFMELGGNSLLFQGHGYEDFESLHRMASSSNKFIKPVDYYNHNFKYGSPTYEGYRCFFSVFGRAQMGGKIFFVHLWHPNDVDPLYTKRNHYNRKIFDNHIRMFDKTGWLPEVISERKSLISNSYDTLILAPKEGKTAAVIRKVLPYLGVICFRHDKTFKSIEDFSVFIKANGIKRVLFFNSYGNDFRLSLYKYCLDNNIRTINFDRGALPDSWFFDPLGFNASSLSYSPKRWDKELSDEEQEFITTHITQTLLNDSELEKNDDRIGEFAFRKKYRLEGKKIIFVPLQRPGDSVIKHFCPNVDGVDDFLNQILALAEKVESKNWVFCIKQHPLEKQLDQKLNVSNVVILDKHENFKDVISSSDAVVLINSGVGVYSLMYGKPTFNIGEAFYSHPGLAVELKSVSVLGDYIHNIEKYKPTKKVVDKFLFYLVTQFYSFGKSVYKEESGLDSNEKRSVTTEIDFYRLALPDLENNFTYYDIERRKEPIGLSSPYYDYYRSWINLRVNIQKLKEEHAKHINKLQSIIQDLNKKNVIKAENSLEKISQPKLSIIEEKTEVSSFNGALLDNTEETVLDEKQRKMRKLKTNPKLYFIDMIKNTFRK